MIQRLRAWWRRINEHWRQKRELLLAADRAWRELSGAAESFEELELFCLRLAVLSLEASVLGQRALLQAVNQAEALTPAGSGAAVPVPTIH